MMTTDAHRLIQSCSVCHHKTDLVCQRCREPYCSHKCQLLDWSNHKSVCVPIPTLVKAAGFGIADFPTVIFPTRRPSKIVPIKPWLPATDYAPLRKPRGVIDFSVDVKADVVAAKQLQQNSLNFPLKTESEANSETIFPNKDAVEVKTNESNNAVNVILRPESLEMKKSTYLDEIQQVAIPKSVELEDAQKTVKVEALQKPLEMEAPPKQVISSASSILAKAWMEPFPIEETGFVSVVVQFIPMKRSQTAWVILKKNEAGIVSLLREINKNVKTAPNVEREQIKVNHLYRVPFGGIYYRGVVIEPVTSDDLVLMRLIDYGNELAVPIDKVKASMPMMNKLNAFGFQIKFQSPREVTIGDILKIQVKPTGDIMNVIVKGEVAYATKNDLETVPIPIGKKTKLYCLDYSNIKKGYVAACVYDIKAIGSIQGVGAKISEYCVRSKDSYSPQRNELCLALYDDGEWYRAEIDKVIDSNTFRIVFIDYGNLALVKSSNIRKMPDEFMHQCLMNKCYIKGAPEKPTYADIKKLVSYFNKKKVFTVEEATKENAGYKIHVADLQC